MRIDETLNKKVEVAEAVLHSSLRKGDEAFIIGSHRIGGELFYDLEKEDGERIRGVQSDIVTQLTP